MQQSPSSSTMVGTLGTYASTIRATERQRRAGGLLQPVVECVLVPSRSHIAVANASIVEQIGNWDTAAQPAQ